MLKSKKHLALTPKKYESQGSSMKETMNKKLDGTLDLREQLLRQQILFTQNEEKRAQDKHLKEMELLELNIKIKKKQLEQLM